jgi:hypothetical protein
LRCGKGRPAEPSSAGRWGSIGRDAASRTRLGKPRPVVTEAAGRALAYPRSIRKRKQCVDMALRWELIALSLLAAIGLGLSLGRGDLIFVAVFGAACAMAIIGGMQRFP